MHAALPKFFNPRKLAAEAEGLRAEFAPESLPRLTAELAELKDVPDAGPDAEIEAPGMVEFRLRADSGQKGAVRLLGEVRCQLPFICQRCLEPVRLVLDRSFKLTVVPDDDSEALLPPGVEGLVCEDGRVELRQLVEDELLLAIPDAPMHPAGTCVAPLDLAALETAPASAKD